MWNTFCSSANCNQVLQTAIRLLHLRKETHLRAYFYDIYNFSLWQTQKLLYCPLKSYAF